MAIRIIPTSLPDVKIVEPLVYSDARGHFYESYNARDLSEAIGCNLKFVQDNHSLSSKGVLRGLHYQVERPQGKLVRVISGKVFDVAVDLRRSSSNFGKWVGIALTAENKRQLWIPEGFAHGFIALSDNSEVLYKTTDYWFVEHERTIVWNDSDLGIDWPIEYTPILAIKDIAGDSLVEAEVFS